MAVVEVEPERRGVELVDGRVAGSDVAGADPGDAVHHVTVDAVEVDRVRVPRPVDEANPQSLALARPERRPRDAAVVGPGRVLDPRRDLDLAVLGDELPLAHPAPHRPLVEVPQDRLRVEAVAGVVDPTDGAEVA